MKDLQTGYFSYQVFYDRLPCLGDTLFYLENAFINNQSLSLTDPNGQLLQLALHKCKATQDDY